MFGVVLWYDRRIGGAVIWCEDQGDLAYFRADAQERAVAAEVDMSVGDLIRFDVVEQGRRRLVRDPQRLDRGNPLADQLLATAKTLMSQPGGVWEADAAPGHMASSDAQDGDKHPSDTATVVEFSRPSEAFQSGNRRAS